MISRIGWAGLEDLLMDDEERRSANRRRRFLTVGFGIFILLLFAASYAYDHYKPLPNIEYCEEQGFEAGIERYETIICYSECSTNKITDCKRINAVRK